MAVYSITDMGAASSTVYRRKITQTQRKAPALRLLAGLGCFNKGNTGINMTWTPKFSGQIAANPNLDGGAFITPASDTPVAASLGYGTYEAPARITDDAFWRLQQSAGIPSDFNTFSDLFMEARVDALQAAIKLAEQQLFSGSGSSNQQTGLSTAVASSGAYAGITNGQWVSTVLTNSGTLRPLTLTLMKTMLRTVAAASKAGRPPLVIAPPAMMDAVEALFDPFLQMPQPMSALGGVTKEVLTRNPGSVTTVGGQISMDGFRHFKWESAGVYFLEAPDCTNSAMTNPTNGMYFLNPDELSVDWLPPPGQRVAAMDAQAIAAVEQDFGALGDWQFEQVARGRIDHAEQFDLTAKLGLKLWSRNAHGWLGDVQ